MTEPQAYLNGRFIPAAQASISLSDAGFVQGTTVAEQLRTFGGKLFRLPAHIERLFRSLAIVGVDPGVTPAELAGIAADLAARNHALLAAGDDLGLAILVTPGDYRPMVPGKASGATVCLHSFPLRFDLWAEKYRTGEALATTDVVQVPGRSWPTELKCRSRMHYYLADRQADSRHPGSRALMLDLDGFVTETTTSNIVLFERERGLVMPPRRKILPGITLSVVGELAAGIGVGLTERELRPDDVAAADEAFITGTSSCMLSVVRLNGRPIGSGTPGPTFARFMDAWNDLVGIDVRRQAAQFAAR